MTDAQGQLALIAEGNEYALLSSDGGTTFVLRSKTDHLSAHLQGDDAARFQADYAVVRNQFPAGQTDQILAQLWDQGGYGWLAVADAV
ncbi:MAG: hypothetical protein ACLQUZ_11785 [Rhizomicrobium sp.]